MSTSVTDDGWLLSAEEIRTIGQRKYRYNAWSDTILDPYMQPFWCLAVSYIPTCIAPTTISLIGLCCNLLATSITIYLAPTFTEILPPWTSFVNAISIFLYQTCDGLDGKQSARTQESEVEEYSDHAVDSISVTLNAILLAAALQLGDSPILLGTNLILAMSAFFAAHWAAQRTNTLVFGRFDVTEAQRCMIAIHLTSAMSSPGFWETVILGKPLVTVKDAVCLTSAATLLLGILGNMCYALGSRKTPLEKHGTLIPRPPVSFWPLAVYQNLLIGSLSCVRYGLLSDTPAATMLIIGLFFGKAGVLLILQKAAGRDWLIFDWTNFIPMAHLILQRLCGQRQEVRKLGAWTLVLVLAMDVGWFHFRALLDIARARDCGILSTSNRTGKMKLKSHGCYVVHGNLAVMRKKWHKYAATEVQEISSRRKIWDEEQ